MVHSWELLDGLVAPTARTERPEFLRAVTAGIMREAGVEKVTGLEWNARGTEGGHAYERRRASVSRGAPFGWDSAQQGMSLRDWLRRDGTCLQGAQHG